MEAMFIISFNSKVNGPVDRAFNTGRHPQIKRSNCTCCGQGGGGEVGSPKIHRIVLVSKFPPQKFGSYEDQACLLFFPSDTKC